MAIANLAAWKVLRANPTRFVGRRASTATSGTGGFASSWLQTGIPPQPTAPSTAVACDNTTVGTFLLPASASVKRLLRAKFGAGQATTCNMTLLNQPG